MHFICKVWHFHHFCYLQNYINAHYCVYMDMTSFWNTFQTSRNIDVRGSVHHSRIHTEIANKMQQCIKIYYSTSIWSSTCFGRHTAHHQELKTALAASGFAHVKGCGLCGCWTLTWIHEIYLPEINWWYCHNLSLSCVIVKQSFIKTFLELEITYTVMPVSTIDSEPKV
jgi:hypothetical protein